MYYRNLADEPIPASEGDLAPAGGTNPVVLIANNTDTLIPGTKTVFGSTAPPSAAVTEKGKKGKPMAVFAGFDNEENPTLGGIYLAPLTPHKLVKQPNLTPLVKIGDRVPGEKKKDARFNKLGEGVAFDGRFVAFWGAWGTETKTIVLQCRTEGNADRVAFCNKQHPTALQYGGPGEPGHLRPRHQ